MKEDYILAINPGSTSTQVGLFRGEMHLKTVSISHTREELELVVEDQVEFRKKAIFELLDEVNIDITSIGAIAARGGRLKPISSGVYRINESMIKDSYNKHNGNHASRLAIIVANEISKEIGCDVFTVDPISVDEMDDKAKISGLYGIDRKSLGHNLNLKAVGVKTANDINKKYEDINIVVAHLGGGTSISAHRKGRIVDITNDFEGVFTPERSGGLPNIEIVKLCFSDKYTEDEIFRMFEGKGGFYSYLGTKNIQEIEMRIKKGDTYAKLIMDAYIYQLTKIIGSMVAALEFNIDAISLTGGIAHSNLITSSISNVFMKISPVYIYPGSFEIETLALRTYRAINGLEEIKTYPGGVNI